MADSNHRRLVKLLFDCIIEMPSNERETFLEDYCAGDPRLRKEVLELVAHEEQLGSFLDDNQRPAVKITLPEDRVGQVIGPYIIREHLGEGGMGEVYVAEQKSPVRRKVALKIIKLGMETKEVVRRFENERQALALMSHPSIAKVLDGGATEQGRPFFVMELVRGMPITEFCDSEKLSTHERLKLFISVCQAVQHAHMKGIIHRDLKPSNIIVEVHDGQPIPKVIDFGIAKATHQDQWNQSVYTQFSQLLGTPQYMSPEQAKLSASDIDTRTDIYALGVLLYQLLTGTTPFAKEALENVSLDKLRQFISEHEVPNPSERVRTIDISQQSTISQNRRTTPRQLVSSIKGELDWVVTKALEKDRDRRYETASAFALDVKRYLDGQPVEACPPTIAYRVRKYVARHRRLLAFVIVVLMTAAIGAATSISYARRATRSAKEARQAQLNAEQNSQISKQISLRSKEMLYAAEMQLVSQAIERVDIRRAKELLDAYQTNESVRSLRKCEWDYYSKQVTKLPGKEFNNGGRIRALRISPNGEWLAVASNFPEVSIYRTANWTHEQTLLTPLTNANGLAWSPDSKFLVAACSDGALKIWNFESAIIEREIAAHRGEANDVSFSIDERTLFSSGDDGVARSWDPLTGEQVHEFVGHEREVESLAVSPDGQKLATASSDRSIAIWKTENGKLEYQFSTDGSGGRAVCVTFSADGSLVAAGNIYGDIYIVDVETKQSVHLTKLVDGIQGLTFLNDGERLASIDQGGMVAVHDVSAVGVGNVDETRRPVIAWIAHNNRGTTLALSKDGKNLVTGGWGGYVRIWNPDQHSYRWRVDRDQYFHDFDVDSLGRLVVCGADIELWDLDRRKKINSFANAAPLGWETLACAPKGNWLAAVRLGQISLFECHSSKRVANWVIDNVVEPSQITVTNNGQIAMLDSREPQSVQVYERSSESPIATFPTKQCRCIRYSPDGRWLAVGHMDDLHLYDLRSGSRTVLAGHTSTLTAVCFHPDVSELATVSHDRTLKIWDLSTGSQIQSIVAHTDFIDSVEYLQDGKSIATAGHDGRVRVWHAETGQPMGAIVRELGDIHKIRFTPDGKKMVGLIDFKFVFSFDSTGSSQPQPSPSFLE
ncbi:serine/threonine-protein kinase [Thalassoglobus neptunius]|nr:serine/threonine-protein kinase [Thalassoglobus neptunius]